MQGIKKDKTLPTKLEKYRMQRRAPVGVKSELEPTRGAYNMSLLEVIEDSDSTHGYDSAIKQRVTELTHRLNMSTGEEMESVAALNKFYLLKELFALIDQSSKQNRDILLEELRQIFDVRLSV
ncbi:MAG: hypothetical protein KUG81_11160 [Gammaproteobacteria bacterium]|nr:hypothetical protein [Gammaproteobacteria bacterium]